MVARPQQHYGAPGFFCLACCALIKVSIGSTLTFLPASLTAFIVFTKLTPEIYKSNAPELADPEPQYRKL